MKEVLDFLVKNPMRCLATADGTTPHVRPWGFMCEHDGGLWFCTANTKKVFSQLKKNPHAEFAFSSPEFVTVRISGEVTFSADAAMKRMVFESSDLVKSIYKTPENPTFEVFALTHGRVIVSDFSGQPPRTLEF